VRLIVRCYLSELVDCAPVPKSKHRPPFTNIDTSTGDHSATIVNVFRGILPRDTIFNTNDYPHQFMKTTKEAIHKHVCEYLFPDYDGIMHHGAFASTIKKSAYSRFGSLHCYLVIMELLCKNHEHQLAKDFSDMVHNLILTLKLFPKMRGERGGWVSNSNGLQFYVPSN
ncbi:hypothetical protein, partial, partial [Absidia glauca]